MLKWAFSLFKPTSVCSVACCVLTVKNSTCQIVPMCHPEHSLLAQTHPVTFLRLLMAGNGNIWPGGEVKEQVWYYFECDERLRSWRDSFTRQWEEICFIFSFRLNTNSCFSSVLIKVQLQAKHSWTTRHSIDYWVDWERVTRPETRLICGGNYFSTGFSIRCSLQVVHKK